MGTPTIPNLAGTETEKNLNTALGGESRVYLKYYRYAEKAEEEGYLAIAEYGIYTKILSCGLSAQSHAYSSGYSLAQRACGHVNTRNVHYYVA